MDKKISFKEMCEYVGGFHGRTGEDIFHSVKEPIHIYNQYYKIKAVMANMMKDMKDKSAK